LKFTVNFSRVKAVPRSPENPDIIIVPEIFDNRWNFSKKAPEQNIFKTLCPCHFVPESLNFTNDLFYIGYT